jgi:putative oxidoreductase
LVLFLFLVPATVIAHNFWTYHGAELQAQLVNFSKNLAILGGLLFVVCREELARVDRP